MKGLQAKYTLNKAKITIFIFFKFQLTFQLDHFCFQKQKLQAFILAKSREVSCLRNNSDESECDVFVS